MTTAARTRLPRQARHAHANTPAMGVHAARAAQPPTRPPFDLTPRRGPAHFQVAAPAAKKAAAAAAKDSDSDDDDDSDEDDSDEDELPKKAAAKPAAKPAAKVGRVHTHTRVVPACMRRSAACASWCTYAVLQHSGTLAEQLLLHGHSTKASAAAQLLCHGAATSLLPTLCAPCLADIRCSSHTPSLRIISPLSFLRAPRCLTLCPTMLFNLTSTTHRCT